MTPEIDHQRDLGQFIRHKTAEQHIMVYTYTSNTEVQAGASSRLARATRDQDSKACVCVSVCVGVGVGGKHLCFIPETLRVGLSVCSQVQISQDSESADIWVAPPASFPVSPGSHFLTNLREIDYSR